MVTYLVFTKQTDTTTTYILASIPIAYSGLNVVQKGIFNHEKVYRQADRECQTDR